MRKALLITGAVYLASWLAAATVSVDVCYTSDPGSGQCIADMVAGIEPDTHTWSDAETGAVTCAGTNVVLGVEADLTLVDWISNSATVHTWDYQVTGDEPPTGIDRCGTSALLLFENNLNDEHKVLDWLNNSSVAFSNTTYWRGSYSAEYDSADTDECIHTDGNVGDVIKGIEFWYYQNSQVGGRYLFLIENGSTVMMQTDGANGLRVYNNGGGGAWSPYQTINNGEWYNITIRLNGSNTILRVQDEAGNLVGSERTSTGTWQPTGGVFHIGNHSVHTVPPDGFIDNMRLHYCEIDVDDLPTIGDHE